MSRAGHFTSCFKGFLWCLLTFTLPPLPLPSAKTRTLLKRGEWWPAPRWNEPKKTGARSAGALSAAKKERRVVASARFNEPKKTGARSAGALSAAKSR